MRIRRTSILFMVALLAVPALAGPAFAGGRVERFPLPGWLKTAIVVTLLVVAALYVCGRRRHRAPGDGISSRSSSEATEVLLYLGDLDVVRSARDFVSHHHPNGSSRSLPPG